MTSRKSLLPLLALLLGSAGSVVLTFGLDERRKSSSTPLEITTETQRIHSPSAEPAPTLVSTSELRSATTDSSPPAPRSWSAEVRVMDWNRKPVAEVGLAVEGSSIPQAFSNADGLARLGARGASIRLHVVDPDWVGLRVGVAFSDSDRTPSPIWVAPRLHLHGVIRDIHGEPIQDASLEIRSGLEQRLDLPELLRTTLPREWHTRSTASGSFEWKDAPCLPQARLIARHPRYEKVEFALDELDASTDLNQGQLRVDLTMMGKDLTLGQLKAVLLDMAGEPVAHATVRAGIFSGISNHEGEFDLSYIIENDEAAVEIEAEGFLPHLSAPIRDLNARQPRFDGRIPIVLSEVSRELHGTLRDSLGRPAKGWKVTIVDGAIDAETVRSDSHGEFCLTGLGAGPFLVEAMPPSGSQCARSNWTSPGEELHLQAEALRYLPALRGQVVDADGHPLAGASVRLRPALRGSSRAALRRRTLHTDAAGNFECAQIAAVSWDIEITSAEGATIRTRIVPPEDLTTVRIRPAT